MVSTIFVLSLVLAPYLVAADIVRPCRLTDLKCIGRILSDNSYCNPNVYGSIPSRYTVARYRFDAPYFNATYVDRNLIISNSNQCRVSEFYLNRSTNNAVLAVDCPNLNFASNRDVYQHISLREDQVYNYYINGTYPLIRLTTTLHYNNGLNLCTAFTFADVAALPTYSLNPANQRTANYLSKDLSLLNIYERECFFWRAPLLARFYINSLICNFGCNF